MRAALLILQKILSGLKRILGKACLVLGGLSAILLVLAFTRIPFDAHRWLGTAGGLCSGHPEAIVVLGGSGMPSGPELMRCDLAANLTALYPDAEVIFLLPNDSALAAAMERELTLKAARPVEVWKLLNGRNTREQALDLQRAAPRLLEQRIALVTAPENMYRSLLTFRKAGFVQVCGCPAFDHALFDDLRYEHGQIGGRAYVPDVSAYMDLRYNFWNQLKLEVTCLREYTAILYYKLNGWI